jgi:microcystin-dependent protein
MAETTTVNYGWTKPDPGGSPNTWGTTLNGTTDKVDAKVYANEQGLSPIGAITMYAGAAAPANWLLCNGATLLRAAPYDKLFAVLGTAFNVGTVAADSFMLPNLGAKYPLGANPINALGTTGGNFAVTLATANLPAHQHPITDVTHTHGANQAPHTHTDSGHAHTITDQTHSHLITSSVLTANAGVNVQTGSGWQFPGPNTVPTDARATGITGTNTGTANLDTKQPAINLVAGGTNLSHTENAGGGTAFNVVSPFVALNYIVRFQ